MTILRRDPQHGNIPEVMMDDVSHRNLALLVVIASSEMDVYVAWSDEEGYEKQVEYETYPGIEKGEADSERGDYGSDNNSPLG